MKDMKKEEILSRNARYHIIEGALYISTGALLSAQTIMPALIKRLGGSDILVGTWPVVVYLAYFLPQVISANYSGALRYRKPFVIKGGLLQRIFILALACALALWGKTIPSLALTCLFVVYVLNQAISGSVSPIWMDFLAKTTSESSRGKLMGWRTSFAAALGLLNGLILTALLGLIAFPYNYASALALAFIYQMSSLVAQRKIREEDPSPLVRPVGLTSLMERVRTIVRKDPVYRKFLIASALLTVSFSSVAFFTVAAMQRIALSESTVGVFTVITVVGQILSGIAVGWIADIHGTRLALILCAGTLLCSIALILVSSSLAWFYVVFAFAGANIGVEMYMRYNFAVECAPAGERAMYVGIMNAWFAPFYLLTPFAGWICSRYGYDVVFAASLLIGVAGAFLLWRMPDSPKQQLALSSK